MSRRRLAFVVVLLVGTVGCVEEMAYLTGALLRVRGVYYPPQSLDGFEDYAARRDPLLGWPPRDTFGHGDLDAAGSRVVPAFPQPGGECVALFGDSFTYGDKVSNESAWGNQLARRLGCRVANYGTPGYGSDQAELRFESRPDEAAPVVVLVHLTENIARNLAQLRGLIYPNSRFGLKPRFVLEGQDELRLVPFPELDRDGFARLVAEPERYLEYDPFAPGRMGGVSRLRFPYTASVVRGFGHIRVRAALAGRPWYAELYDPGHPANGVELTARILERFHRIAASRGKRSLSLILPTGLDLEYYRERGTWVHESLVRRLAERGVPTRDLAPRFAQAVDGRDPCEIFTHCSGHLNPEGNALLAEFVEHELSGLRSGVR